MSRVPHVWLARAALTSRTTWSCGARCSRSVGCCRSGCCWPRRWCRSFSCARRSRPSASEILFVDNPMAGASVSTGVLTALGVAGRYLWLLAWPRGLSPDYSYAQIPLFSGLQDEWLAVATVCGALAVTLVLARAHRLVLFLAVATAIVFLPVPCREAAHLRCGRRSDHDRAGRRSRRARCGDSAVGDCCLRLSLDIASDQQLWRDR